MTSQNVTVIISCTVKLCKQSDITTSEAMQNQNKDIYYSDCWHNILQVKKQKSLNREILLYLKRLYVNVDISMPLHEQHTGTKASYHLLGKTASTSPV